MYDYVGTFGIKNLFVRIVLSRLKSNISRAQFTFHFWGALHQLRVTLPSKSADFFLKLTWENPGKLDKTEVWSRLTYSKDWEQVEGHSLHYFIWQSYGLRRVSKQPPSINAPHPPPTQHTAPHLPPQYLCALRKLPVLAGARVLPHPSSLSGRAWLYCGEERRRKESETEKKKKKKSLYF